MENLTPGPPIGPETSPPIDRAQFNEILGVDDDETFREMVGFFIQMFPAEIENLATATANGTSAEIRELAHRAKSAAVNVAATPLTALLENMERKARSGEVDGLPDFVDRVRAEFRRIEAYSHRS
jgi:HPt (histidine-containing phosphotransfer) domain-containing protein